MIKLFIFILGLAIGSFLNVLIDRLPKGQSIMGRSHCDHCKHKLNWYELIPVVSFIIQKGKGRCCHKKLSLQYPIVEIITGILFLLIFNFQFSIFNEFSNFKFLIILGIICCLIVIFFADFKYQIIPDSIQIALFIFVLIFNFQFSIFNEFSNFKFQISNCLLSGFIVMLPILVLYLITKGKGMGFGDVKLAFIMGVLLGWRGGLMALYIAFITGAIYGVILILLKKKKLKSKIAFGPFLIIGTIFILVFFERLSLMIFGT